MPDAAYQPLTLLFQSHGIVARWATDRAPEYTYLNLNNSEQRQEVAASSRYGSIIINRDPDGTSGGTNYLLPDPVVGLSRLAVEGNAWRYAFDSTGKVWRRTGDTQGPYATITGGLSGNPPSTCVNTTFGSGTPYLFIATDTVMLKDNGTFAAPQQWGITPPTETANAIPYAPQLFLIDGFSDSTGSYTVTNITGWASGTQGTVVVSGQTAVSNFVEYLDVVSGLPIAFNGCLATFSTGAAPVQIAIIDCFTSDMVFTVYTTLTVETATAHGLAINDVVPIAGTSNPLFNNTYTVLDVLGVSSSPVMSCFMLLLVNGNSSVPQHAIGL